jgi:hypothetical protein
MPTTINTTITATAPTNITRGIATKVSASDTQQDIRRSAIVGVGSCPQPHFALLPEI